ncbi:F-box/FBD/LRR-repeat protein [Forsythia ovata]|uniref:F-box/FBD/LRR-repeat protein n=1 Tax=Forsythia ovata TaxID=205694 RepID=A0ABD1NTT2_9LAMI
MDIAPFQPVDRISNLPDNVIDQILTHFTICDVAKTSILSKEWRYKWLYLPHLIFDDKLWLKIKGNQESARTKFSLILYQILFFRRGPITKLTLIIPKLIGCSAIDHLIYFLSKNSVEEFTFKIQDRYQFPSSLFMCLRLKHLSLSTCAINPPSSFNGFKRLISLELEDVSIDAAVLGNLISKCPLLEQLVLNILVKFDGLEIAAPMLKLFKLKCYKPSICFLKSQLLEMVSVAAVKGGALTVADENCNFVEYFKSLHALQKLHINCHFMTVKLCLTMLLPSLFKFLAADKVQTTLSATLNNLKVLELSAICLDSLVELSCSMLLIRSSPNLEKLNIEMRSLDIVGTSVVMDFLEVQDYSDVSLNRLHEVTLGNISGTAPEMALIKLLLEKSSTMRRMDILSTFYEYDDKLVGTLKELNKFWRASPNAEIENPKGHNPLTRRRRRRRHHPVD